MITSKKGIMSIEAKAIPVPQAGFIARILRLYSVVWKFVISLS
jgi:hypothetical protein